MLPNKNHVGIVPNGDHVEIDLEESRPRWQKALEPLLGKYEAFMGECGNFAFALKNAINKVAKTGDARVVCAFPRIEDRLPTHCVVEWGENMWDFDGEVSNRDLVETAREWLRDEGESTANAKVRHVDENFFYRAAKELDYPCFISPEAIRKVQEIVEREIISRPKE